MEVNLENVFCAKMHISGLLKKILTCSVLLRTLVIIKLKMANWVILRTYSAKGKIRGNTFNGGILKIVYQTWKKKKPIKLRGVFI